MVYFSLDFVFNLQRYNFLDNVVRRSGKKIEGRRYFVVGGRSLGRGQGEVRERSERRQREVREEAGKGQGKVREKSEKADCVLSALSALSVLSVLSVLSLFSLCTLPKNALCSLLFALSSFFCYLCALYIRI